MFFGVIRPGWDVEGGMDAEDVDGHCFYDTYTGSASPATSDWEGMQAAREQGDRIGMLLDLDQGSMTCGRMTERLGVMRDRGADAVRSAGRPRCTGDSARIESAAVPAATSED